MIKKYILPVLLCSTMSIIYAGDQNQSNNNQLTTLDWKMLYDGFAESFATDIVTKKEYSSLVSYNTYINQQGFPQKTVAIKSIKRMILKNYFYALKAENLSLEDTKKRILLDLTQGVEYTIDQ